MLPTQQTLKRNAFALREHTKRQGRTRWASLVVEVVPKLEAGVENGPPLGVTVVASSAGDVTSLRTLWVWLPLASPLVTSL